MGSYELPQVQESHLQYLFEKSRKQPRGMHGVLVVSHAMFKSFNTSAYRRWALGGPLATPSYHPSMIVFHQRGPCPRPCVFDEDCRVFVCFWRIYGQSRKQRCLRSSADTRNVLSASTIPLCTKCRNPRPCSVSSGLGQAIIHNHL